MKEELTLLILAGGRSERLGEVKSLLDIDGQAMVSHVVDGLSPLTDDLIISCRLDCDRLKEMFPSARIAIDEYEKDAPLTGLKSSLPLVRTEYVAVVPCDSPVVRREVIELLLDKARDNSAAIPKWPNGFIEPLIAVYRVGEFRKAVNLAWENEEMKISKVIEKLEDVEYVSTEEIKKVDGSLESFININTPEDLEKHFG